MRKKNKRRRKSTTKADRTPSESRPEIVSIATHIASTEKAIDEIVTKNVQIQMRLNECISQEQTLRKMLSGLHREMDKHTASTRVL